MILLWQTQQKMLCWEGSGARVFGLDMRWQATHSHAKQNMTHLFSLHSVQAKINLSTKLKIREPFPRKGPLSYLAALIMRKLSQGILQLVGYVKKVTQYIYQATPHQFRHHAFHGIGWGEQGGSKFPTSCTLYVQFPLPSLVVPASVYFFFAKNCAMLQNLFSISPGTCPLFSCLP